MYHRKTIDEMAGIITKGNDIGLWAIGLDRMLSTTVHWILSVRWLFIKSYTFFLMLYLKSIYSNYHD